MCVSLKWMEIEEKDMPATRLFFFKRVGIILAILLKVKNYIINKKGHCTEILNKQQERQA